MKLPKAYEPSEYEPGIYALWETSGSFAPSGQGEPYSIVMPPPNANGNLHVGHGYMIPLQDILVRYHRMRGRDTVWIPGADHAGFETWVVFERNLEATGKSRFDFSRDSLYQMTWDFVHEQRGNMELQLRALGASCDWSSLVFTLDDKVVSTVYDTFKKLWEVWPECKSLLEKFEDKPAIAILPAVQVHRLNAALGLPVDGVPA